MRPLLSGKSAVASIAILFLVLEGGCTNNGDAPSSNSNSGNGAGSGSGQGSGPPQCGLATGTTPAFFSCSGPSDCVEGTVCIDNGGDNAFYCKPLCKTTTGDCPVYIGNGMSMPGPGGGGACVIALCSDGSSSGVGVCEPTNSRLPAGYEGSSCCTSKTSSTGGGNPAGAGPTGGGTNGCAQPNPISCPNNLCCPTQFPQCGGGCGYNCCPANSTGGGTTGGCGQGCPSGSACVNLNGTGSCSPECTSSSQCSTGCCGALQGTSVSACLPATYCSSSTGGGTTTGGGQTCADQTACLAAQVAPFTSGCEAGGYHLTVTNKCAQEVQYEYCFQKTDGTCDCGEGTVAAGQTLSSVGDYACNATGHIRYQGISPADWGKCPVLNQCN